jgi:PPOX class probable F420-dependent enzyme
MAEIPEAYRDLFTKPAFAHFVTLMPDGSPQVTPVWVDLQDGLIVVNTAKGRLKDRNMQREPRVALAISDPANPYRYLQIRGRVAESTEEGAEAHIDRMAKKYFGLDSYPYRQSGEKRVIYKIRPERVQAFGNQDAKD